MSERSVAQIEADLVQTRRELAATVTTLGEKLDVAGRVRGAVHHPTESARRHWPALALTAATVTAAIVAVVVWQRRD